MKTINPSAAPVFSSQFSVPLAAEQVASQQLALSLRQPLDNDFILNERMTLLELYQRTDSGVFVGALSADSTYITVGSATFVGVRALLFTGLGNTPKTLQLLNSSAAYNGRQLIVTEASSDDTLTVTNAAGATLTTLFGASATFVYSGAWYLLSKAALGAT